MISQKITLVNDPLLTTDLPSSSDAVAIEPQTYP